MGPVGGPHMHILPGMMDEYNMYNLPNASGYGASGRDYVSLIKTKEIPKYRLITRLKLRMKLAYTKSVIKSTTKWLRRYQAEEMILNDMEKKSVVFGDKLRIRSDLKAADIQEKVSEINKNVNETGVAIEAQLPAKFKTLAKVKKAIANKFEKFYIFRLKFKASRKYSKKAKRIDQLSKTKKLIENHKKILQVNKYHNYNVYSVNLGKIKPENNYKGMLPDPIDVKEVKGLINSGNEEKVAANNSQSDSNVEKNQVENEVKKDNVHQDTVNKSNDNVEKQANVSEETTLAIPSKDIVEVLGSKDPSDSDKFMSGEYHFKKDQIIQDMSLKDLSEQAFKTQGMTPEQIRKSQEILGMLDENNNDIKSDENTMGRSK